MRSKGSIQIDAMTFNYDAGNRFIAIWPDREGLADGWIARRFRKDTCAAAVERSVRNRLRARGFGR